MPMEALREVFVTRAPFSARATLMCLMLLFGAGSGEESGKRDGGAAILIAQTGAPGNGTPRATNPPI